jgi:hypothetical protein
LAQGIVGNDREPGILCSGLNFRKGQATKKGAPLKLKKYSLCTIEPLAKLWNVAVSSRKYRNPNPEPETPILALGSHGFQSIFVICQSHNFNET